MGFAHRRPIHITILPILLNNSRIRPCLNNYRFTVPACIEDYCLLILILEFGIGTLAYQFFHHRQAYTIIWHVDGKI